MSKQVMAIQGQVMARDLGRQPTKASAPDWDLVAGPRPLSQGTADKSTAKPGSLSADGVAEWSRADSRTRFPAFESWLHQLVV